MEDKSKENEKKKEKNLIFEQKEKKYLNKMSVSDREILKVIKEEKNFPQVFSKRVKLSTLVNFYCKLWNNEFTDDEVESDTDG